MRGTRRLGSLVAILAAIGLVGAGHRRTRIHAVPRMPVGMVYEVHTTSDATGKIVIDQAGHSKTKDFSDHFVETRRCKVLAVAHGIPTKIQVTYVDVQAQEGRHPMATRASARIFVVTLGKHPDDLPAVTENGAKVNEKLARMVRSDAMNVIVPKPLGAVMRKALDHPHHRIVVPAALMAHFMAATPGSTLVSANLEVVRMKAKKADLRLRVHQKSSKGPIPLDVHTDGRFTVDALGRNLDQDEVSTLSGKRTLMTPRGMAKLSETGKETVKVTYDYAVKAKEGGR